jgi:hypothetical protein
MLRRYFRIIKSLPVFQVHPVLMLIGLVALNGEGQYTPTLELWAMSWHINISVYCFMIMSFTRKMEENHKYDRKKMGIKGCFPLSEPVLKS